MKVYALIGSTAMALVAGHAAMAQEAPPSAVPRQRSGTEATAPQLPTFPSPALPALPAPPAPVAVAPGDTRIVDVLVRTDPGSKPAKPQPHWQPAADASGLVLVHEAGQPLDARWVRQQFVANTMIGQTIGNDRIAALIQLINLAYLHNGYINSGVLIEPGEGNGADGVLHLHLVSGHLAAEAKASPVSVVWKNGHTGGLDADFIRNRMPAARANPLNIQAIEHDFRLLADNPAVLTVNADLKPGARPGEASLVMTVDPQPSTDLYVSVANSRSPSVGGERVAAGGSLRNALAIGDAVSAEYGRTSGLSDFSGGYATPFFIPALTLHLRGGFDNAAVVDRPLVPLNIQSNEYDVEGGLSLQLFAKPLIPGETAGHWRPAQDLAAGLQVVHRRVLSSLLGEPFSFGPGANDGRTEYTALQQTFDYTYRSINTVLALSTTVTQGLTGTRPSDLTLPSASQSFTAVLAQGNFARRLNAHQLELRMRVSGQLSRAELYSPERFAIGGAQTVRGYREGLVLADSGAAGSIELAQPVSLTRNAGAARTFDWGKFVVSVFSDGGVLHNHLPPQPAPRSIYSAGSSLAWTPAPWLSGRVTFAQPLRTAIIAGDRNLQDRGFEFSLVVHPIALGKAIF